MVLFLIPKKETSMEFIAILCVIWIVYTGLTEKKKGDRETVEYEKKQNEELGLESRAIRLEKMCPTKSKKY